MGERPDGLVGEGDPGPGEQLLCLVEPESKVCGAQLDELTGETETMESERRIVASRQDHPELWRPAVEQQSERRQRPWLEQVMQIVEERAPDGYKVVTDVLSQQELEDIAANYKRVAGFQVEGLNAKPPIVQRKTG